MSRLKGMLARARAVLRPRSSESRMEEEFRFHVEMETECLVQKGVPRDDARRRALVSFGGLDHHREAMRDGRGARWFDDVAADVRYALRGMRRSPGFALAVALTLGVGIGVNGLVFGYVNSLLFRPVASRNPEQLVALFHVDSKSGQIYELGYDDYRDFNEKSGVFDGLAGMTGIPLNLTVPGASAASSADLVWGEMVTENFFSVLGMEPVLGRFFTAADAPQGANPFAVVSYDSWQQRFHGDPGIVGRVVRINGSEFTITGVAARGFKGMRTFGFWPEMWVPAGMHKVLMPASGNMLGGRGDGWLMTFGRMHRGWDRDRTQRAAVQFAAQLEREYPRTNTNASVMLLPAATGFDHPAFVKPRVLVLASSLGIFAGAVILLIICANLANLQLARAAARAREIAIRLSVGCSRGRLTRQLLVEAIVLAIPGAIIAMALVQLSHMVEAQMLPHLQFRVGMNAEPDHRVALYTAVVSLVAIALFGLAPALRSGRVDLVPSLAKGGKAAAARPSRRVRGVLVISQLAMSVVLLVGGTLFVRSLAIARSMDLGFDPSNRLLVSVNVGLQSYDEARGRRFYDDVIARARELPGVISAAWAFPVPFDTYGRGMSLYVEGAQTRSKDGTVGTDVSMVTDDFVSALGLRLQGGRTLTAGDSAGAPLVMVVSRSLATRLWPGKDPIGQRARRGGADGPEIEVVGVLADAKFANLGDVTDARAYVPLRQRYRDWETLVVHTRGDPLATLPAIRNVVTSLDPTLPMFGAMSMEQSVSSGLATSRTAASIAGFFGALALLIATIGLYAVVAGSVTERTRELGVRLALGSTPRRVLGVVMARGAVLGAIGLVIGLALAVIVARSMASLLYGLSASDPVTFALVPIVLALVVLVATYLPARRAVRLDPMTALRAE